MLICMYVYNIHYGYYIAQNENFSKIVLLVYTFGMANLVVIPLYFTLLICIKWKSLVTFCTIPYRTKLWRGENFGEFGESLQFAKFFCQHSR